MTFVFDSTDPETFGPPKRPLMPPPIPILPSTAVVLSNPVLPVISAFDWLDETLATDS